MDPRSWRAEQFRVEVRRWIPRDRVEIHFHFVFLQSPLHFYFQHFWGQNPSQPPNSGIYLIICLYSQPFGILFILSQSLHFYSSNICLWIFHFQYIFFGIQDFLKILSLEIKNDSLSDLFPLHLRFPCDFLLEAGGSGL